MGFSLEEGKKENRLGEASRLKGRRSLGVCVSVDVDVCVCAFFTLHTETMYVVLCDPPEKWFRQWNIPNFGFPTAYYYIEHEMTFHMISCVYKETHQ